jgi:hypothetical protein
MKTSTNIKVKPDLKPRLFWDERYDDIDWEKGALSVIERVLDRGNDEDYEEIIRFYGRDRIIHALTKEYCVLANFMMDHVAKYFGIPKEEFTVWKRRQSRPYYWK